MTEGQLIALLTGPDGLYQCDARELHSRLQVGRDFSNWIKDRIEQYGFIEGEDYSPNLAKTPKGSKGGRPTIDYLLTLDMAKELAMIENNAIGRQVRRYFIRAEKELRERERLDRERERAELQDMARHVLPVPGVKGKLRDQIKPGMFGKLLEQSREVARLLAQADSELERYNLHCQLRQINDVLGYRTPSLAEIAAGGFTQE